MLLSVFVLTSGHLHFVHQDFHSLSTVAPKLPSFMKLKGHPMIPGWQFTEEAIMEEVIIEVILAHATRQCHRPTIFYIFLSDLTNRTNSTSSTNSSNSSNSSDCTGTIAIMEVILAHATSRNSCINKKNTHQHKMAQKMGFGLYN